jgi:hypothetical protein
MTTETCRYRGYDIVPNRQWSQWCVSVYTTRADLPLFSRSTLRTLALGRKRLWPRPSSVSTGCSTTRWSECPLWVKSRRGLRARDCPLGANNGRLPFPSQ